MTNQSNRDDFELGVNRFYETFDPNQRTGQRARATTTRALIVYGQPLAFESKHVEIAAITLQVRPHPFVEQRVDLAETILIFGTQIGKQGSRRLDRRRGLRIGTKRDADRPREFAQQLVPVGL